MSGWIEELFHDLDHGGVPAIFSFLDENVEFRFGSFPPDRGRQRFAEVWQAMSPRISAMRHEVLETWQPGDRAICRGTVHYDLEDGGTVTVPFATFFRLRDGRVTEYLIYVDAAAVFGRP